MAVLSFLHSVAPLLTAGGVLLAIGVAMMLASNRSPDNAKPLRLIAWPFIGCGGLLVVTPLAIMAGISVLFLGAVQMCNTSMHC